MPRLVGQSSLSSVGNIWALLGGCGDNSVLLFKIPIQVTWLIFVSFSGTTKYKRTTGQLGQLGGLKRTTGQLGQLGGLFSSTWTASMLLTPGYDGVLLLLYIQIYITWLLWRCPVETKCLNFGLHKQSPHDLRKIMALTIWVSSAAFQQPSGHSQVDLQFLSPHLSPYFSQNWSRIDVRLTQCCRI